MFESPSGRDIFCLKKPWNFPKNTRPCVENECCCPRTVNISNVNLTLKNNISIRADWHDTRILIFISSSTFLWQISFKITCNQTKNQKHIKLFIYMQKYFLLIFYCTCHEILLLLIVEGGAIIFDALHQLLYLLLLLLLRLCRSFCGCPQCGAAPYRDCFLDLRLFNSPDLRRLGLCYCRQAWTFETILGENTALTRWWTARSIDADAKR